MSKKWTDLRILLLSSDTCLHGAAVQLAREGANVRYYQRVDRDRGWVDSSGIPHLVSWRHSLEWPDLVVADSPSFSNSVDALARVPMHVGLAPSFQNMLEDMPKIAWSLAIPTFPSATSGRAVLGLFSGAEWVGPFLDLRGKAPRSAQRAGKDLLLPLTEHLSKLTYCGPFAALYTRKRSTTFLLAYNPHMAYPTYMSAMRPLAPSLAELATGGTPTLEIPPRA